MASVSAVEAHRYQRRRSDTAGGGPEVLIHLQARRFFCDNYACAKGMFAEQMPGLSTGAASGPATCRHCCKRSCWHWSAGPVPG